MSVLVLLQCFFDTFPLAKNVQRFLHEMPSRFCSFYFVNVHTHIVVCVCVSIGNAHDIFQPLLAGTQRRTDDVPSLSRMCWLFCDLHFLLYFSPSTVAPKPKKKKKKGGERNFSGVAVWWCCGFLSHTCQVHPTPRYTTQAGERERERKEEKIRVETTPFSQILFQRIFIFHFLTTVTHTQTSNPRNDRPVRQLRNSK